MNDYTFGMKAEQCPAATNNDFATYSSTAGGNHNPYNKAYFNDPSNLSVCKDSGRITSIPSPYARMHITDLAFQEYNCGTGLVTYKQKKSLNLSQDYKRAMSHCLDIFELLFHADEFDFKEKGVTLHKIDLISTHSQDAQVRSILYDDLDKLTEVGKYVKTLDIFRDEYMRVIKSKGVDSYKFDFTSLYLLKYKGKTFASTSPFTGFCAKSDCDLKDAQLVIPGQSRKLLSDDPKSWLELDQRDEKLRDFLYLLFKNTGLKDVFCNFYESLENSFDDVHKNKLDKTKFGNVQQYRKFNLQPTFLQKIEGKGICVRPDGLDCSYLKYLLYLQVPIDLSIHQNDYKVPITQRRFPAGGQLIQWVGVNDLLADALFVLNYEINDNYTIVPFEDQGVDGQNKRRCLLPIKRFALDYFTMDELIDNLKIVKRKDGVYAVSLTLSLENESSIVLRREYSGDNAIFPNGIVVDGSQMNPFAFGIYPFVKSNNNHNIYKVLYYNSFDKDGYGITFYKRDNEGNILKFLDTEMNHNRTNDVGDKKNDVGDEKFKVNCEYHHLESKEGELEFVEISLKGKGTSLIVPKLRQRTALPGEVTVAIDLGTSNTYIAYTHKTVANEVSDPKEICTNHDVWNELTFMNKKCDKKQDPFVPDKNREDLYLQTVENGKPSDEWLDSQLCEFIPSRIDPNMGDESYRFPIPTVINFLRVDSVPIDIQNQGAQFQFQPLLHYAIPFAYYERGIRAGDKQYDLISDGSRFKWFYRKDARGNFFTDQFAEACFKAFVSELLFIVRSHLVCCGYDLTKTKILWSYPLSFDSQLVREYKETWQKAYKEIINPAVSENQISDYVLYTNESRSPIFECIDKPSTIKHLSLLVDIGGGSTDIIGYKDLKPLFISSFGFAGNSLYLDGQLNSGNNLDMSKTIMGYYAFRQPILDSDNSQTMKKISKRDRISTIMNYGFTKDSGHFIKIFDNLPPQYMLLMHNAAIVYHTAQLCKIMSPDEMPVSIYFTGNGSRLLNLNHSYKSMVKDVFAYIYGKDVKDKVVRAIRIDQPENPKAATAVGALKGLALGVNDGQLETNDNAAVDRIVMLGDKGTVFSAEEQYDGAVNEAPEGYIDSVKDNVKTFVDMFYDKIYNSKKPIISKDEVLDAIDNVIIMDDPGEILSDSLFFKYIALLMEELSFNYYRDYLK